MPESLFVFSGVEFDSELPLLVDDRRRLLFGLNQFLQLGEVTSCG